MNARVFVFPRNGMRFVVRSKKTISDTEAAKALEHYLSKNFATTVGTEITIPYEDWTGDN